MRTVTFVKGMLVLFTTASLLGGCRAKKEVSEAVRDANITLIVDNLGDMSYNDGIYQELLAAEERYRASGTINLNVDVYQVGKEEVNRDEVLAAFQSDSELFIIAYQVALPILEPAAAYFPEKKFILIDAEATSPNIYFALFKPNEASYLCGALAARMSGTGTIGIVTGMDIPVIHDFVVGYILGALSVDPDCKVIVSAVGNFYDAGIGYELAAKQFELGADVCFNVAGGAGLGVLEAASDFGRYAIGVDIDQTEHVEIELRNSILTSCLKNFDSLIAVLLEEYFAGTLRFGESGRYGLREGAVGIARNIYYRRLVPEHIQRELDGIEEQINAGAITVRSAFEMTRSEIEELFRSVRP